MYMTALTFWIRKRKGVNKSTLTGNHFCFISCLPLPPLSTLPHLNPCSPTLFPLTKYHPPTQSKNPNNILQLVPPIYHAIQSETMKLDFFFNVCNEKFNCDKPFIFQRWYLLTECHTIWFIQINFWRQETDFYFEEKETYLLLNQIIIFLDGFLWILSTSVL